MNIAEQVIRAKQDLDDVYTAGQSSMVDQSKLIPKTVSGSYISVDDVSEIPHGVACKVESVNLMGLNDVDTTRAGITIKTIGGSLFLDGTVRAGYEIGSHSSKLWFKPVLLPAGTYTCNVQVIGAGEISEAMLRTNDEAFSRLYSQKVASGETKSVSFTLTEPTSVVGAMWLYNTTYDNTEVRFWLNEGTTALPYTPYVKPEEVKVTRCGKNLAQENAFTSDVEVGYKIYRAFTPIPANATFTVSGDFSTDSGKDMFYRFMSADGTDLSYGYITQAQLPKWTRTATCNGEVAFMYFYSSGNAPQSVGHTLTVNNFQLELGSTATAYEPYNGQTLTPATDGTVEGMTSVSPYMNIFSDTEGVNIKADYNKSYGMQTEYDRFWDAYQQNGTRAMYAYAFGSSWSKETFKPKYVIKPVSGNSAYGLFALFNRSFKCLDFREYAHLLDLSAVNNGQYMFQDARFDFIDLDLSHFIALSSTFSEGWSAGQKTTITLKVSEKCTTFSACFSHCTALTNLTFKEGSVIAVTINLQHSPLTKASITSTINALSTTATGQTLTLKLSAVNTAFETSAGAGDGSTSAEFAALVATKTNWTITMI